MGLVIRHALVLVAAGLALGIAGASAGTRFMSSLLFGVQPAILMSMAAAVLALGLVGLLAAWHPPGAPRRSIPSLYGLNKTTGSKGFKKGSGGSLERFPQ